MENKGYYIKNFKKDPTYLDSFSFDLYLKGGKKVAQINKDHTQRMEWSWLDETNKVPSGVNSRSFLPIFRRFIYDPLERETKQEVSFEEKKFMNYVEDIRKGFISEPHLNLTLHLEPLSYMRALIEFHKQRKEYK